MMVASITREQELNLVTQSRFKQGDRVRFSSYSTGKVLGHRIRYVYDRPLLVLAVLLDPQYRVQGLLPIEDWIESDQIRHC